VPDVSYPCLTDTSADGPVGEPEPVLGVGANALRVRVRVRAQVQVQVRVRVAVLVLRSGREFAPKSAWRRRVSKALDVQALRRGL
jgi:hypothetical protein